MSCFKAPLVLAYIQWLSHELDVIKQFDRIGGLLQQEVNLPGQQQVVNFCIECPEFVRCHAWCVDTQVDVWPGTVVALGARAKQGHRLNLGCVFEYLL